MRKILLSLALIFTASPALAQSASPIQQYLQSETGYRPQIQAPAPQAQNPSPYAVAQQPPVYYATPTATIPAGDDGRQINSGVSGMNN